MSLKVVLPLATLVFGGSATVTTGVYFYSHGAGTGKGAGGTPADQQESEKKPLNPKPPLKDESLSPSDPDKTNPSGNPPQNPETPAPGGADPQTKKEEKSSSLPSEKPESGGQQEKVTSPSGPEIPENVGDSKNQKTVNDPGNSSPTGPKEGGEGNDSVNSKEDSPTHKPEGTEGQQQVPTEGERSDGGATEDKSDPSSGEEKTNLQPGSPSVSESDTPQEQPSGVGDPNSGQSQEGVTTEQTERTPSVPGSSGSPGSSDPKSPGSEDADTSDTSDQSQSSE